MIWGYHYFWKHPYGSQEKISDGQNIPSKSKLRPSEIPRSHEGVLSRQKWDYLRFDLGLSQAIAVCIQLYVHMFSMFIGMFMYTDNGRLLRITGMHLYVKVSNYNPYIKLQLPGLDYQRTALHLLPRAGKTGESGWTTGNW